MKRAPSLFTRAAPSVSLGAVVVLVCASALVAANEPGQIDSGWVVGTPSGWSIPPSHNPSQQIILEHVLQQTRVPLLRNNSPTAPNVATKAAPRVAARPDGINGWRPTQQQVPPLGHSPILHAEPTVPHTHPRISADMWSLVTDERSGPVRAQKPPKPLDPPVLSRREKPVGPAGKIIKPIHERDKPTGKNAGHDTSAGYEPAQVELPLPPAIPDDDDATAKKPAADSSTHPPRTAVKPAPAGAANNAPIRPSDALPNIGASKPPSEKREDAAQTTPIDSSQPDQAEPADGDPASTPTLVPLSRPLINLRTRVRSVLKGYYRKTLNSRDHDAWEVMHGMLAYGVHSRIRQGGPRGNPITAVGWLCYNKPCKGLSLLYVTPDGELRAKYGVGLQGHLGQLLAMLAQSRVSPEYPIRVGNKEFAIRDLIEAEKKTCYPKSELTFKLLALQYYIDLNDKWVNEHGVEWDFPRLIREEIPQPMRSAACGGTHRLSAFSLTVKRRRMRGEPVDGEYARAEAFVKKHQQYAFRLQNRDGSLSTSWFNGRGDEDDINRRIKTTGHILEWLCYSLSDEQLREQRTIRSVSYLANLMYSNYDHEWEVGPMCHAIHALLLYDERVFQPFDNADEVASYRPRRTMASRPVQDARSR